MYASALLSALLGASSAAALAIEGRAANVLVDITFHTGTQFSGENRIVQISTPAENSNQLPCQNLQGEAIDNRAQSVEVPPNFVCFFFADYTCSTSGSGAVPIYAPGIWDLGNIGLAGVVSSFQCNKTSNNSPPNPPSTTTTSTTTSSSSTSSTSTTLTTTTTATSDTTSTTSSTTSSSTSTDPTSSTSSTSSTSTDTTTSPTTTNTSSSTTSSSSTTTTTSSTTSSTTTTSSDGGDGGYRRLLL